MLQSTPFIAQVGAPVTPSPVAFGTGPTGSLYVRLRLLVLSVPPVGAGPAVGAAGDAAGLAAFALTAVALFGDTFRLVGVAARASIVKEMPAMPNTTPSRLRL